SPSSPTIWLISMNCFFFSSRRRHTRWPRDWSSDVCSSDLEDYCRISDLGSRNGTFLNGSRIQEAVLFDGDLISAGQTRFRVHIRSEERRVGKECRSRWVAVD